MAKLTKALRSDLGRVLVDLKRAQEYIDSDRIAVCARSDKATTTLHFTRSYVPGLDRSEADVRPLTVMAKDIGSDLCRLREAIRSVERILMSEGV